jgi:hypothetical protein
VFYVLAICALPLKVLGVPDTVNPLAVMAIWVLSEATGWGARP